MFSHSHPSTPIPALSKDNRRRFYDKAFLAVIRSILYGCFLLLAVIIIGLVFKGFSALYTYKVPVTISYDAASLGLKNNPEKDDIMSASFGSFWKKSFISQFPLAQTAAQKRSALDVISENSGFVIRERLLLNPDLLGKEEVVFFPVSSKADMALKNIFYTAREFKSDRTVYIVPSQSVAGDQIYNLELATGRWSDVWKDASFCEKDMCHKDFTAADRSVLIKTQDSIFKVISIRDKQLQVLPLTAFDGKKINSFQMWTGLIYDQPEKTRTVSDQVLAWLHILQDKDRLSFSFPNIRFFTQADSRHPEQAGVAGAIIGSLLTLLVCLGIALPCGVGAAIYLEEFAPRNWFTRFLEVNINNLSAVPSIIYGLLGLAIFLNVFGMPRSSPLVGGCVLALMIMPVIIIATRAALVSVPKSIRHAAWGVGATKMQALFDHVLPLALPGIMTGTILGIARALGETAPLIMIGMVAFIASTPGNVTDAATVLPVQIYLWADSPEQGFREKTILAISVLLIVMVMLNLLAVHIRTRFERRW